MGRVILARYDDLRTCASVCTLRRRCRCWGTPRGMTTLEAHVCTKSRVSLEPLIHMTTHHHRVRVEGGIERLTSRIVPNPMTMKRCCAYKPDGVESTLVFLPNTMAKTMIVTNTISTMNAAKPQSALRFRDKSCYGRQSPRSMVDSWRKDEEDRVPLTMFCKRTRSPAAALKVMVLGMERLET